MYPLHCLTSSCSTLGAIYQDEHGQLGLGKPTGDITTGSLQR